MKKLAFLAAVGALSLAARVEAQQPRSSVSLRTHTMAPARTEKSNADLAAESAASMGQMTPEMWFYQQELRRYEDPKMAVRRKAEFRAAQRERRIAAMQWYGFSNSRPQANPTPWTGVYSPRWVSNDYRHPFEWSGGGRTAAFYGARSQSGIGVR